ncbi:hypothetical protein ABW19_dt0205649 [Dactylella cylindrospora]|nr:hypothetical protein ABW19_dt0205649 [Dactylella cylindrospora]
MSVGAKKTISGYDLSPTSPEAKIYGPDNNGEAQEGVGMKAETRPIYLMALDCSELFNKCLDTSDNPTSTQWSFSSEVTHLAQEYQSRFNAWASFLCVLASENVCLDHRLRRHPSLQDMFIRLLDVLRRNLFLSGIYEEPGVAQGSSDAIDSAGDYNITDAPPSNPGVVFSSIEESITHLNKLGIAIRLSSRSTAIARARTFASQNPELIRLSDFEDRAYLALQNLYPNASERLRQQLVDSMTDRYARLQYEFYRVERPGAYPDRPSDAPSSIIHDRKESVSNHQTVKSGSRKDATGQIEDKQTAAKFPESSIDTGRLHKNLEEAAVNVPQSKSPKTLTIHTNRHREPSHPEFKNGEDSTLCNRCFQVIDRSLIHTRQNGRTGWSDEGR